LTQVLLKQVEVVDVLLVLEDDIPMLVVDDVGEGQGELPQRLGLMWLLLLSLQKNVVGERPVSTGKNDDWKVEMMMKIPRDPVLGKEQLPNNETLPRMTISG